MPPKISRIIQALEPSATLAMAAKAKELKAAGRKVYDLSVGEPDFTTPEHICQAAVAAMKAGHTHYTVASGIPELKKAVVEQYQAVHGLKYTPAQVVIANGAKHAIHNVFTVLLDPGDEVIIPAPYWVSYAELVKLTGAVPVIVETPQENNFKLTPEKLRRAITTRPRCCCCAARRIRPAACTRPRNWARWPTWCSEKNLLVVSDEIYERLIYGGQSSPVSPRSAGLAGADDPGQRREQDLRHDRLADRLEHVAGERVAKAMADLQSQETSNPCSISQYAAVGGLTGPQDCVDEMLAEFAKRREFVAADRRRSRA